MRYGYFDNEKREYVIERVDLPTSWTNYLGVEDTCVVVNHTAGGDMFYKTQVVATAGSGQGGIEIIQRENPDILFSDIRMPGMDGLTMIAALKSEHPHMQIAILTGFRDFEYAREAIRLGVTRFLLKSSKMEELEEAVSVMVENLSDRKMGTDADKTEQEPEGMAAGKPRTLHLLQSS